MGSVCCIEKKENDELYEAKRGGGQKNIQAGIGI